MGFKDEFGSRLQERRKERGYTQNTIIDALKTEYEDKTETQLPSTDKAWGNYENGKRELSLELLAKTCSLLGVSSDYLLGLSQELQPGAKQFEQNTGISESAIVNICKYKNHKVIMECINQFLSSHEFSNIIENIAIIKANNPSKNNKANVIDSVMNGSSKFNILMGNNDIADNKVTLAGENLNEWLMWQSSQSLENLIQRIVTGDKDDGTR